MTTEENVCKIIDEYIAPSPGWSINTPFADLGSDSLAMMELVMEVEEEFNVEISDAVVEALNTPKDLINFLEDK